MRAPPPGHRKPAAGRAPRPCPRGWPRGRRRSGAAMCDGRKCGKSVLADRARLSDDQRMSTTPDKRRQVAILAFPGRAEPRRDRPARGVRRRPAPARGGGRAGARLRGARRQPRRRGPLRTLAAASTVPPHASLAGRPATARHADRRRRRGPRAGCASDRATLDWIAGGLGTRAAHGLGLHRRLPARARRAARRPAGDDALGVRPRALQRDHPDVLVDPEPIFVRDGRVWTSAGVTAGWTSRSRSSRRTSTATAALTIARHLVLFLRRPGNQSQFSATLAAQQPEREPLREVQRMRARGRRRRALRRGAWPRART